MFLYYHFGNHSARCIAGISLEKKEILEVIKAACLGYGFTIWKSMV